jgi:pantoate--beta-alanine ligase
MSDPSLDTVASLPVARSVAALRRQVAAWRRAGKSVALVPTMGALHRGHLALVDRGRQLCTRTVASIFVNPTQFGPNEDFARYPRDEAGDAAMLVGAGCDLLYAPAVAEMYSADAAATIDPGPIAAGLCGRFRPGHFRGVATVVAKLLLQSGADVACFGEKDYQQLQVIRRVVRDLDIPARIEGVPTVREADGLALSSRNAFLAPEQRVAAPALHRTLREAARRLMAGEATAAQAVATAHLALAAAGFAPIDYVEVCDAETLVPVQGLDRPARILAAAWLGSTRLIDNVEARSP